MLKKIIFLVVFLGAALIFLKVNEKDKIETQHEVQTYTNSLYGFSFAYSDLYKLITKEESGHFEVILVDKNESERFQSEGSTSINIHVHSNVTLEDWLKRNESNFNLAIDSGSAVTAQGIKVFQYTWDGLYLGKTIALSQGDDVIALTGTYLEKGDSRYKDFEKLVNSFILKSEGIQKEAIIEYLKKNISALSPEKEVLGGTFYVTKFTPTNNNSGIVEYEDGYNSYKGRVSYSFDDAGGIRINLFEIIK